MKLCKLFLLACLMLFFCDLEAQDLHFSQYDLAPLMVNPGLTGGFNGTARINAINRGQWWSVAGGNPISGNGYNTMAISVDSPIIRGLRKQDWIGVGLSMTLWDKAGNGDYGATGSSIMSVAYHLSLDKKQTSVLAIGLQRSSLSYQLSDNSEYITRGQLINSGALAFDDMDLNGLFDNATDGKINTGASDWVLGAVLTAPMGRNADMKFGIAMSHIFTPDKSFATTSGASSRDELPRKFTVFGQLYNSIGKRMVFKPGFLVQHQGVTTEIQVNGRASYLFSPEKDIWLNFGLGLRPMNAADLILFLGADIKDIRVGLSYDINFGGFTAATNSVGAFELGVSYIWKYYKKPKVDPKFICPRL